MNNNFTEDYILQGNGRRYRCGIKLVCMDNYVDFVMHVGNEYQTYGRTVCKGRGTTLVDKIMEFLGEKCGNMSTDVKDQLRNCMIKSERLTNFILKNDIDFITERVIKEVVVERIVTKYIDEIRYNDVTREKDVIKYVESVCAICCDNNSDSCFNECGHTMCYRCGVEIGYTCPFCKTEGRIIKLYNPV